MWRASMDTESRQDSVESRQELVLKLLPREVQHQQIYSEVE
jgi:hypothetical protein